MCVTETSLCANETEIPKSIKPDGYEAFSTGTLTQKGGATIFVKKFHDYFERDDLMIQTKEYETVWIEITTDKKNRNIVIGCIYRHPHYNNLHDFTEYLNLTFKKLNKEKKDVYIAGDLNLDLLQYENNSKCSDFFNLVTSYGFLPLILQPTRFSNTTQTLIDNIFTNALEHDTESGNILIEFADHLTQFASIKKTFAHVKRDPIFKFDESKFNEKLFLEDLSIQIFSENKTPNDKFSELLWKYESLC